jgi:hypothetical protein
MTDPCTRPLALALLCLLTALATPLWAATPKPGDQLPASLSLSAPPNAQDRKTLGITEAPVFKLAEIKTPLLIVEVIGVYCPLCHIQAPLFEKLFSRMSQDSELSGKVAMLGLAAGATKEEVEYLRDSNAYAYPIAFDPEYVAHKQLGEPKTPFTMILDAKGRVLFAHLGVIEDMDAFYAQILGFAKR